MNAVPESVKIEFFRVFIGGTGGPGASRLAARHEIRCGPVDHLNPQYRVQLFNHFANRQIRADINPNQRLGGQVNGTDLSAQDPTDSAIPSPEVPNVFNIANIDPTTGTVTPIILDAARVFAATQLNGGGA